MVEMVRVLRDPEGYRRRNREVVAAGGVIGTRVHCDGTCETYAKVNGVEVSRDDEWITIPADEADAYYEKLAAR